MWPTSTHPVEGQEFSTEAFVEAVIADVKKRQPVDSTCIATLSWSSSGPAAYTISLQPDTAVTGSYIAMSVFRPDWLPPLSNAKGRRYHIEHSPDDAVCPYGDAKRARAQLAEAGAIVNAVDYDGGHGWRGDIYGRIRAGLIWLTAQ